MKDAVAFAQRYVEIKQNELDLIFHTRKSLLYCKDTPWIKKDGPEIVDKKKKETENLGSNDGAETCELVGLFLLYSIGEKLNKDNISLYRDEGLACFENNSGHQSDKIRKKLIKIFQIHV